MKTTKLFETIDAITTSKDETIRNVKEESARVISAQKAEISLLTGQLNKQSNQLQEQGDILTFLNDKELAREFEEQRKLQNKLRR